MQQFSSHCVLAFCMLLFFNIHAQDDLLDDLEIDHRINTNTTATFKALKIVNFESTKLISKKDFSLIVSHRFGSLKNGIDTFFGLDDAFTRLNFVYGINDNLNIGLSRSSFQKIYEGSLKYTIIKQKNNGSPFSIVGFNALLVNTALQKESFLQLEFKDRLSYVAQVLIARKMSRKLSLEIVPTFFHDNFVFVDEQDNSQFALGVGGRYKMTKRWSLNLDYGLHLNRADTSPFKNPLSIGFDLETGGHVFQMHFTNAQGMNTNTFLGQSSGNWGDGDIFFGFNLSRRF